MNRRKFMSALALTATFPFLAWATPNPKYELKSQYSFETTQTRDFRINARMFILRVKDGMDKLRFELANEENLQLFKTWLDVSIAKITPKCFSTVIYGTWYEDNVLVASFQIFPKSKAVSHTISPYYVNLRMGPGEIKQDGII